MTAPPAAVPRPRPSDHVRVAWLLVRTVLSVLWFVPWLALCWLLVPWARARRRARLRRPPPELDAPPLPDPAAWDGRTVFLVAGETSGDLLAARAVAAIRARCPGVRIRGYGGPAASAAGAELDRDLVASAVFGVIPVLLSLPRWWALCAETLARFREAPPDLLLTVDFPGLNVRLAQWARRRGVRTVHLVAPAVWAYAPWRVLAWRGAVTRLLALFPFEASLFGGAGIPTAFVGHPSFEAPLPPPRTPAAWPGAGPCAVELLPGSRRREVEGGVPDLLEAAALLEERFPRATFVVRLAHSSHRAWYDAAAPRARRRPARCLVDVGVVPRDLPLLGALACSGTVTGELAAALVPMSVFYRIDPLLRFASWTLVTAPWYSIPNLVLGEGLVPERGFIRRGAAPRLARDFLAVAGTPEAWARQRARLQEVRRRLERPDVSDRLARAVLAPPDWPSRAR